MNDHDYVNFSEDHEMDYILQKFEQRQTEDNREELRAMGVELKRALKKERLMHIEFHPYVENNLFRLESKPKPSTKL
ncbi:hypothetical protein [Vreelandella gomseomensis]|uniref:Uncharacterized protein n=1 Tax=Vreelandella gomseomensis TaxID=370766 RepID=A0ABU1GCA6_9GAMM|nr:hypothetical protein [Halomonas gomseomensis]MDR5875121.1 hypothetical protein [Halomonas gomseomensis]